MRLGWLLFPLRRGVSVWRHKGAGRPLRLPDSYPGKTACMGQRTRTSGAANRPAGRRGDPRHRRRDRHRYPEPDDHPRRERRGARPAARGHADARRRRLVAAHTQAPGLARAPRLRGARAERFPRRGAGSLPGRRAHAQRLIPRGASIAMRVGSAPPLMSRRHPAAASPASGSASICPGPSAPRRSVWGALARRPERC